MPVDETAAPARLQHGSRCPICNNGVLYVIAVKEDGYALHCFNCDTTGSIHAEEEWQHVVPDASQSNPDVVPAGFQLSASQLAAKQEAGVDPYAPHEHLAAAYPDAAPAAPAEPVEPHETHDAGPREEGTDAG